MDSRVMQEGRKGWTDGDKDCKRGNSAAQNGGCDAGIMAAGAPIENESVHRGRKKMALYTASVFKLLIHYLLRTLIYNLLFLSFSFFRF